MRERFVINNTTAFVTRYDPDFKTAWDAGTAIKWTVLFSELLGGNFDPNSDSHIYITSTNRSSFGCESLVVYKGSTKPGVAVYDFRLGKFLYGPTPIHSAEIDQYVSPIKLEQFSLKGLTLVNRTYQEQGQWINKVSIASGDNLDALVLYTSAPYNATPAEQKSEFAIEGSWGPSLEPSDRPAAPFKNTNPLGWTDARTASCDAHGNWSAWEELSPEEATIESGTSTFKAKYLQRCSAAVLTS